MLYIDGYNIELASGESATIKFEIISQDEGDISDIRDVVFEYIPRFPKSSREIPKTITLEKIEDNIYLLFLTSNLTSQLNNQYLWRLKLSNGVNSVYPIDSANLIIRGWNHGKCKRDYIH